jgi:hypothetical protein
MAMRQKKVSVLLNESDYEKFEFFCLQRGHKKSTLISKLIRDFLTSERDVAEGSPKTEATKPSRKY